MNTRQPSVAYIAGPMRGKKDNNFPAFDHAARELRKRGIKIFSPAENDREVGADLSLAEYLRWDFARIIEAHNIILLDGWEYSSGTAKELRVAEDVGARVWRFSGGNLVEWNWDLVESFRV